MLPGAAPRLAEQWREVMDAVQKHPTYRAPMKAEALARIRSERQLQAVQKQLKHQLTGQNLLLLPEYGLKLAILKKLEFVSETEVTAPLTQHAVTTAVTRVTQLSQGLFWRLILHDSAALLLLDVG